MLEQAWIIEGKFYGTAARYPLANIGNSTEVYGYAFCCAYCGRTWARAPVVERRFQFLMRDCRKCGLGRFYSPERPPGSVYVSWDREYTVALPDAVLQWEFDRHMDNLGVI